MARPSVIPAIRDERLKPYLEERKAKWDAQVHGRRLPTLPATADGKVNVRQLVADLGLKPSQVQHFHNHRELADPVNEEARRQGLKVIGSRSRALADGVHADAESPIHCEGSGARRELDRMIKIVSELQMVLAEREVLVDRLRRENSALREQLRFLEQTGLVVRA